MRVLSDTIGAILAIGFALRHTAAKEIVTRL